MKIQKLSYPRPDFIRSNTSVLNGEWEFLMDSKNTVESQENFLHIPYSQQIQVPYCYQSEASGIGSKEQCPVVWYRKKITIEKLGDRSLLLHFGAVDWLCKVWVNGHFVGSHEGGNTPFFFAITEIVKNCSEAVIVVKVEDYIDPQKPQGKQSCTGEPFGCWYTPTTGIWQSVWMEYAGSTLLQRVKATPDLTTHSARVEVWVDSKNPVKLSLTCSSEDEWLGSQEILCTNGYGSLSLSFPDRDVRRDALLWSPQNPRLIDLEISIQGMVPDVVYTYFGLRQVSIQKGTILLNGKLLYQRLILDQGYWPTTLMTPPSVEALEHDIDMAMQMGFNGARKHQKIEDPRYYYLADMKGFLVWGELPSNYQFNDTSMKYATSELCAFVERDFNHPSIIAWVPINESWGVSRIIDNNHTLAYSKMLVHMLKAIDGTRLVSANDGWEQPSETDICAIHDYALFAENVNKYDNLHSVIQSYAEHRMLFSEGESYSGQPILVTEFGGIAFDDCLSENWGYYGKVKDSTEFLERLESALSLFRRKRDIAGFCYTQLSDVMQETNGLLDHNHKPKLDVADLRRLFELVPK